ncbi:5-oxoprolinase/urea amidolyase family protein [Variovorax sp. J22P240]|uniref:5-oxoprolinase subunit B/C family protein n=1 Tax=Variovorax sp. J22P240 TaxID=3053514 RepID=UPI002578FC57|nr:5-oxoprolinase/urea amidolyase family protein [Variovorax sp. J22P240]MDM0000728.1 5-oxoprolinase/urea amidolyase family protein [Variovorax sp. J22P240]
MRFLPVNLDAMLVELDDLPQTLALLASLQAEPIDGIEELVPAARTLLVRHRPAKLSQAALVERIGARSLTAQVERAATLIEIPVDYTGEDLDEVAQMLGLSRDEVIRRHTASEYTVAFTGFAPGFAYLSGGDPNLNVPRRTTPRTRIPAGAVGLAGPFSGVYPQASPGGWQIIGVTATPMWDLGREVPALLQPGFRVRFIDMASRPARPSAALATQPPAASITVEPHGAALEIRSTGLQALFQDTGRTGRAGQGVSASGAVDQGALRAANRLVGNASDMACVEIAYGGFEFVCRGEAVVAFTGADAPLVITSAGGASWSAPGYQAIALSDGDSLMLGQPHAGMRSYLAVRGGFAIAPVLGSCSTDTLARVGPAAIATGDVLPIRSVVRGAIVGLHEQPPADLPTMDETITLDVVMGPRTDWFTPEAVALLSSQVWKVTPQSNRVGLRLAGEQPLTRANAAELPSEGTTLGALQVPPSGQPVLFMADHPLTGGYPVIGAVASYHLDLAGQVPIGASLRFNPIHPFGTP